MTKFKKCESCQKNISLCTKNFDRNEEDSNEKKEQKEGTKKKIQVDKRQSINLFIKNKETQKEKSEEIKFDHQQNLKQKGEKSKDEKEMCKICDRF